MADNEQQMQLVAKLVDQVSDKLKEIQKNMIATEAAVRKSHEGSGKAAAQHSAAIKELRERFVKTKEFVADAFTPALATLGITTFGVGEAMGKLAEQIKGAAEKYDLFNDTIKRGHVGVQYVDQLRTMYQGLGIDAGKANSSVAEMGETFDKLKRGNAEERQRLQGTFGDMLPFIEEAVRGAKNYADAEDQIVDAIKRVTPEVDKQRKAFEALHMPPELATKSLQEIEEARARALRSALAHPTDMNLLRQLNDAYTDLKITQDGFWNDMVRTFGPSGVTIVNGFAAALEHADHWLMELKNHMPHAGSNGGKNDLPFDRSSLFGRFMFGAATPNQRVREEFDALGKREQEETIAGGTHKGVIEAFREWKSQMEALKPAFAPGLKPQAYHPDDDAPGAGRSGFRFGSSGYPLHDFSMIPRSAKGVTDMLDGSGAGVGSGDDKVGDDKVGGAFDRSRFARELETKPWLKDKIFQLAAGEDRPSKGESLLANQAVMETMMNRAAVRGTDLETQARWFGREPGGYYAGRPSHLSELERTNSEANLRKVLGGSNITDYATDNSSGGLAARERATGKFKFHRAFNRESFFSPGWAEPGFARRYAHLREQMREEMAARHGSTGAHLRDHIRDKNLLSLGRKLGLIGGGEAAGKQHLGSANLTVDFQNMPRGIRTAARTDGVFKEVKLNRGFQMALASSED
jgi:hypothetical protein